MPYHIVKLLLCKHTILCEIHIYIVPNAAMHAGMQLGEHKLFDILL